MDNMPNRIVFVFPANMTAGGMPDDTRRFIAAVSEVHGGPVVLMSRGEPADETGLLTDVECVDLETQDAVERVFNSLEKTDITVFVTFSDLLNVQLARNLISRGLRYSVLPAWQVHEFLDWDRPFIRNAVPTIQSSERNARAFNTAGAGGVVEGRATLRGFFRSLKRKVYRQTLGKSYLQNASGIHVFSHFERSQISRLISPKAPNFLDISFGTDIQTRIVGEDQFPRDGRKNIVFWGRVDYYYKGLDIIVDGIALAKGKGIATPFTFWVCGPDYNAGYQKLRERIERVQVAEHVRILAPGDYTRGSIGLLKRADFSILASRWDGYARALRESAALGVPFISNRQSHFDGVVDKFGNGLLFDSVEGLASQLATLNSDAANAARQNARIKAPAFRSYISWRNCARRFLDSLRALEPAP